MFVGKNTVDYQVVGVVLTTTGEFVCGTGTVFGQGFLDRFIWCKDSFVLLKGELSITDVLNYVVFLLF